MPDESLLLQIIKRLDGLEAKVDGFTHDVLVPFSRLEERELALTRSVNASWEAVRDTQRRVALLEEARPINTLVSDWVVRAVIFAAGLAAAYVAKQVGLM